VAKKYTILVIPQGTNNVKRFSLPPWIVPLVLIIIVSAAAMAAYWHQQYTTVCAELPDLVAMEQKARHQEAQLKTFSKRLEGYKTQMTALRTFNQRLRVLANLGKPGEDQAMFGVGGSNSIGSGQGVQLSHTAKDRQLMRMREDLDDLEIASKEELMIQKELAKFLKERRSILAATPSIWPVRGWVTSGFGYRIDPWTGKRSFHHGLDISTRRGTKIIAPASGVVTYTGKKGGYGNTMVISHGHGITTRYAHLSKYKVKRGTKVNRGDLIALVGNTGRSTGPHLHYEVILSGSPTNPRYYILD
jgi:murein DD-endopeptidase MepM/ murein hydrolase activator NlpD